MRVLCTWGVACVNLFTSFFLVFIIFVCSGTGLCGLTAAVVGASITVLTDIPSLEELNEKNKSSFMRTIVDNNQLSAERRDLAVESLDKCSFASYRWGTPLPPSLELANGQFYDVIVASDDLYDDDAFPPLLESLKILVGDNTLVLFSYKRRMDKREIPFFEVRILITIGTMMISLPAMI